MTTPYVMPGQFVPYPEGGPAPEWIRDLEGVETPDMVDLREVPIGTVIQFHGLHPDSIYIAKVIGKENKREIVLWFKRREPPAIGSIDAIVSAPSADFNSPETRRGVMQIKGFEGLDPRTRGHYLLPEFSYTDPTAEGKRQLSFYNSRVEAYTRILVMKPA